ncbi:hypothetical protein [Oceanimonas baumannii]|uniref:hypothetical protein n=1 Tax=Oceanimonas baumannii TaxID=129578 RepID=UPI003A8F0EA3
MDNKQRHYAPGMQVVVRDEEWVISRADDGHLLTCEGINLHHQSHKLIYLDIPWSLMEFQHCNGRVDRYGQLHQPQIRYLLTESDQPRIRGDKRILEILIEKDEQAEKNICDSSEFIRCYDQESEEQQVADFMLQDEGIDAAALFADLLGNAESPGSEEPLAALGGNIPVTACRRSPPPCPVCLAATHHRLPGPFRQTRP